MKAQHESECKRKLSNPFLINLIQQNRWPEHLVPKAIKTIAIMYLLFDDYRMCHQIKGEHWNDRVINRNKTTYPKNNFLCGENNNKECT